MMSRLAMRWCLEADKQDLSKDNVNENASVSFAIIAVFGDVISAYRGRMGTKMWLYKDRASHSPHHRYHNKTVTRNIRPFVLMAYMISIDPNQ